MTRPQIIAMDLDGTSLYDNLHMSERTFSLCRRAVAAGIELVVVTGRSACYLSEMALPDFHYAISNNGVNVVDMHTNKSVYRTCFTPEEAALAWSIIRGRNAFVEVSFDNHVVLEQRDYDRFWEHPLLPHCKHYYASGKALVVPSMDAFIREHIDRIEKFTMLRSGQEITDAIRRDLDAAGLFETRAGYEVDVTASPIRTNKGKALLALAEHLKIPREAVYAFGDGKNDVAMLQAAGCGVAMGNAPDFVKAAADCVCGRCTEDGMAAFLEEHFQI